MDKPKIGDEVVVREQESRASKGFGCVGARLNDCEGMFDISLDY